MKKEYKQINILAIDQARNGAWSVFNYEEKTPVAFGTFSFGNKDFTFARAMVEIERLITAVIGAYDISAIFVEDIQLRKNVDSYKKLAMLLGVLVAAFERNDYLYDFVAPSKWQSYCNARGRTSKEQKSRMTSIELDGKKKSKLLSIQFVYEQFGIETDNDNLSDALCMGWYICNEIVLNKSNQEAPHGKEN